MEEVEDSVPDETQEIPEVEDIVPEPPVLKRQRKEQEKVTCEGCGKTMAPAHTDILIGVKHSLQSPRSRSVLTVQN